MLTFFSSGNKVSLVFVCSVLQQKPRLCFNTHVKAGSNESFLSTLISKHLLKILLERNSNKNYDPFILIDFTCLTAKKTL